MATGRKVPVGWRAQRTTFVITLVEIAVKSWRISMFPISPASKAPVRGWMVAVVHGLQDEAQKLRATYHGVMDPDSNPGFCRMFPVGGSCGDAVPPSKILTRPLADETIASSATPS